MPTSAYMSDSQYTIGIPSYWNSVYNSSPQVREIISPTHQRKDDLVSDVLANRQNNAWTQASKVRRLGSSCSWGIQRGSSRIAGQFLLYILKDTATERLHSSWPKVKLLQCGNAATTEFQFDSVDTVDDLYVVCEALLRKKLNLYSNKSNATVSHRTSLKFPVALHSNK